jgi:hypothetical protein
MRTELGMGDIIRQVDPNVLPSAAAAKFSGKRLTAPAAAEVTRTSRRVGMTFSFVGYLPKASDRFAEWSEARANLF